jgi:hypothetical protein
MRSKFAWAVLAVLALGGCGKKAPEAASPPSAPASVPLVPENERSRSFDAVNSHLELGGTLYGYADVDGDDQKIADELKQIVGRISASAPQAYPLRNFDFKALFTILGFDDIKALGFSSVRGSDGNFRNTAFLYIPGGRHGLLAVCGGPPSAFVHPKMAPADADFYGENEIDLAAAYATVKEALAKLGPPGMADRFEAGMRGTEATLGFSILDAIGALHGRVVTIARVDPDRNWSFPTGGTQLVIPRVSIVFSIDGIGSVVEGALAKSGLLDATVEGTRHFYALKNPIPVEGVEPVFAVDGSTFYAATSPGFLRECLDRQSGLDQNPDFQRLLTSLGSTGDELFYVTPRFFARLRQIGDLNAGAPAAMKSALAGFSRLPPAPDPIMGVRQNLPDGILIRSLSNASMKKVVMAAALYNPVTIGLVAAIVVPALQNHYRQQQEQYVHPSSPRAPLSKDRLIRNNLRLLFILANRHYRKTGATTATYDDLIGPGKMIPALRSIDGEDYRQIQFGKGQPLRVRTKDGKEYVYPMRTAFPNSPPPPQKPAP